MRRTETARRTGAGVRGRTKPGCTEAGRQNKDHEMGIENYARRRSGEKADIFGAPAVRLKELSPAAHHRLSPQVQALTAAEPRLREEMWVVLGLSVGKGLRRRGLRFKELESWVHLTGGGGSFTAAVCSGRREI